MRETDEHTYEDPRAEESGSRPILSGWALWVAIMLGLALWAGVRALLPVEDHIIAGVHDMSIEAPARAAGAPPGGPQANGNFVPRLERPTEP